MTRTDLTVIGGGVIGLSIAWEAARRGMRVQLLERDQVGRGTSWAAAGILPPANLHSALDPLDRLRGLSHQLHPQWAEQLQAATGIDTGLRRCGGIYLATSAGEAAALVGLHQFWQSYAIESQALSDEQMRRDEPRLGEGLATTRFRAAYLLPDEYQLRSPDHLAALRAACQNAGVQIHEAAPVRTFAEQNFAGQGRAVQVETDDGNFVSDRAVLTAGAWSSDIARVSGIDFDIIPVRGQILLYRLAEAPFRRVINEGHRYLVAREDGHLLVGSCEEEVGFRIETTAAATAALQSWAEAMLPELNSHRPLRSWAGLRPATVDGFPYLGRVPDTERLFVATGHFRSGLHLSCGTAVVMADLLTGQQPRIDLDAFRIGRG